MVEYVDVLIVMVACLGIGIGTGFILGVDWAGCKYIQAAADIRSIP